VKIISITGGKGGTGKSTVSILLANKFRNEGKSVVLCDCDVECPNDYLLLGMRLGETRKKILAQFPKLDEEKCVKCGLCARSCRDHAIFQPRGKYPLFLYDLCSGCGLCWNICPQGAIVAEEKTVGEIFVNDVRGSSGAARLLLVTGRSVGMVEETGPIVTATRDFAAKLAKKVGADYLLLDTAVGMHCGVIRALSGADMAYAVTEPTPLGAHDLGLILKLLKKLEVPAKIVLNQADLGDRRPVMKIAQKFSVRIEREIPYSQELVTAYSHGQLGRVNFL